jgi:hypothetical protein
MFPVTVLTEGGVPFTGGGQLPMGAFPVGSYGRVVVLVALPAVNAFNACRVGVALNVGQILVAGYAIQIRMDALGELLGTDVQRYFAAIAFDFEAYLGVALEAFFILLPGGRRAL